MAAIFNINRIWWLLQRYFVENRHRELYYWGIFVIVFMFFHNDSSAIGGIILVAGIVFCGRFFREIHSPTSGLNYFMIPATQAEKLVTSYLLTIVYFFGMMLAVYTIGNLAGTFLNNLFANVSYLSPGLDWFSHKPLRWCLLEVPQTDVVGSPFIWIFFNAYLFIQAIFMLGSLYFKRSAVFKTILTLFVAGFVCVVIMMLGVKVFLDIPTISDESINININGENNPFGAVGGIIPYVLIPYLWILGYFKLTEKEV